MARTTRNSSTRARDHEVIPDMITILGDYVARYNEANNASRRAAR